MTPAGDPMPPPKKNKALRAGPIAVIVLICLGGLAYKGRHRLHEMAREAYHNYKNAQAQRALASSFPPERAEEPLVVYQSHLGDGWQDWSWATHKLGPTILMSPEGYKGVYLHHDTFSIDGYGSLQVFMKGTANIKLVAVDSSSKFGQPIVLKSYLKPALGRPGWQVANIPLGELGVQMPGGALSGITLQAATSDAQPPVEFDGIALMPDLALPPVPTSATIGIHIDPNVGQHPISPFIYGMAFAPADFITDLRLGSNRWGGNDKTRYNWVHGNAVNAARDWGFRNRWAADSAIPPGPSSGADRFVRGNKAAAASSILTVPTIGWVARDMDNNHASQNVPNQGDAPAMTADGAIAGYDPTANRMITSIRSVAHKGQPFVDNPTVSDGVIYQDEWIHHLAKTFGDAAHGGVRFYEMDNEPDIWDVTHTDVHPARMGYDDMLKMDLDYATAVKAVDPTAEVLGPVSWGWTGYQYSALDRGTDNFHTHADSDRHGGGPFLGWFLKQFAAHDAQTRHRSLDILDVHYYPQAQGVYGSATDPGTTARRLRATNSWWDPKYQDESWIGEPIRLLPRLKGMIAQNYPGTKLAVTEWNFGADGHISGALAIADTLGIFGREGLDMANYWAFPQKNTPGYLAFKLFRNADGHGHGFGDTSVPAMSADQNRVSAYAAMDSKTGYLTLLVVNKMPKALVTAPITLPQNWRAAKLVDAWRVVGTHPNQLVPVSPNGSDLSLTLLPYSATLYRYTPNGGKL